MYKRKTDIPAHGIIDQSYSREVKTGKLEEYPLYGTYRTKAMGEGSIEGDASQYEMKNPNDTEYMYSFFNKKQYH